MVESRWRYAVPSERTPALVTVRVSAWEKGRNDARQSC